MGSVPALYDKGARGEGVEVLQCPCCRKACEGVAQELRDCVPPYVHLFVPGFIHGYVHARQQRRRRASAPSHARHTVQRYRAAGGHCGSGLCAAQGSFRGPFPANSCFDAGGGTFVGEGRPRGCGESRSATFGVAQDTGAGLLHWLLPRNPETRHRQLERDIGHLPDGHLGEAAGQSLPRHHRCRGDRGPGLGCRFHLGDLFAVASRWKAAYL
mmetsp:Transcript_111522/g.310557  ORF Transcript_111522/g.310557 Transcript_111522/m.310557 type:complete len:213 (-) Transcript_111522:189-827(-)